MPNLITHFFFANKVKSTLDLRAKEVVESQPFAFKLGAMGPDYLFVLRELGMKQKRYPNRLQHKKVYETFASTANYLAENPDKTMLSYMLGYICHYASDRLIHAYVYYFCEEILHCGLEQKYHSSLHTLIESAVDCKVLEQENESYTHYPAYKTAQAPQKVRMKIGKLYEAAINPVHGIAMSPRRAALAFKLSQYLLFFGMDKTGCKKKIMGRWEDGKNRKKKFTSHMRPPIGYGGEIDYFNEKRNSWNKVRNGDELVNYTVWETLDLCQKDAVRLIDEYLAWVYEGKPIPKEEFKVNFEGIDLSLIK